MECSELKVKIRIETVLTEKIETETQIGRHERIEDEAPADLELKQRIKYTAPAPAPVRPKVVWRSADAHHTTTNLRYIAVAGLDWKEKDL
jgi:hypothetical protein